MNKNNLQQSMNMTGLFTLSLRLVIGWTYFSALWRRMVLAPQKLDPESAGYLGEKFNHFLPNALGIQSLIEYLVTHADWLFYAMVAFTIIEGVVGLLMILGLFTRIASAGVFFLAMGILLGSGWIGTTCLDEWQIGILGLAGGFTLFLTGSGHYSMDYFLIKKSYSFTHKKWFKWIGSGILPMRNIKKIALYGSLAIFGLTLFTNQYFHGGIWGKLHNKSKSPIVQIANPRMGNSALTFEIYRVEGADVYGSFLIGIELLGNDGEILKSLDSDDLSKFPKTKIKNHYVAKIKPGKHSLVIPLGAKADLTIDVSGVKTNEITTIKLIDISGAVWKLKIN